MLDTNFVSQGDQGKLTTFLTTTARNEGPCKLFLKMWDQSHITFPVTVSFGFTSQGFIWFKFLAIVHLVPHI